MVQQRVEEGQRQECLSGPRMVMRIKSGEEEIRDIEGWGEAASTGEKD